MDRSQFLTMLAALLPVLGSMVLALLSIANACEREWMKKVAVLLVGTAVSLVVVAVVVVAEAVWQSF